jgi:hypothetical protein
VFACYIRHIPFLPGFPISSGVCGNMFPSRRPLFVNGLCGIVSWKIELLRTIGIGVSSFHIEFLFFRELQMIFPGNLLILHLNAKVNKGQSSKNGLQIQICSFSHYIRFSECFPQNGVSSISRNQ